MKIILYITLITIIFLLGPTVTIKIFAVTPTFTTLQPGGFREINQNLKVNIVFVGYHQGTGPRDINEAVFRAGLPHRYRTLNVNPATYLVAQADLTDEDAPFIGNSFDYDYNIVYANKAFEDAYFNYLPSISVPCDVTVYQQYYNTQQTRSLDITDNHCVEATLAENWLAENGPGMIGVDTTKNTVFLINGFGRPDFRFHTYLPYGFPDVDPDTGFNFSVTQKREMIAWGGTTPDDQQNGLGTLRRVWFHDLSAGPDSTTLNFILDTPEFFGLPYYTMPPAWEYGNTTAYRPFTDISGDLSKIVRYAAIDLQFTKSPILPPDLSPPKMPQSIEFEVSIFNGDPTADGRDYLNTSRYVAEEHAMRPYNTMSASVTDHRFSGRIEDVYECAIPSTFYISSPSCYGHRPVGGLPYFTDMFLYLSDHRLQYVDGDADYEVPVFAFFVPNEAATNFLGLADDNHTDGRQSSFCYLDIATADRRLVGATAVAIHETGHHLGATHPHDGYDYEDGAYYDPSVYFPAYFLWTGDEVDSVMNYLHTSNNFSQFDRDNMNRWMTAIYINQANAILPKVLAGPQAYQVSSVLTSADADAASSLSKYQAMDYPGAVLKAKSAYEKVLSAAAQINVKIEPNGYPSGLRSHRLNPGLVDPRPGRTGQISPVPESDGMRPFR